MLEQEKVVAIPGTLKRTTLCRFNTPKKECALLIGITAEEEKYIDNNEKFILKINATDVIVPMSCIIMYGEVDVTKEEDLELIKKFNLVSDNFEYQNFITSNFNYDKSEFTTINNVAQRYPTEDPIKNFLWNHCLIGKPERILVCRIPRRYIGTIYGN